MTIYYGFTRNYCHSINRTNVLQFWWSSSLCNWHIRPLQSLLFPVARAQTMTDIISGTSGRVPGCQAPVIIRQVEASAADSPWKSQDSLTISLKQEEILDQGLQGSALWCNVWFPEYRRAYSCSHVPNLSKFPENKD